MSYDVLNFRQSSFNHPSLSRPLARFDCALSHVIPRRFNSEGLRQKFLTTPSLTTLRMIAAALIVHPARMSVRTIVAAIVSGRWSRTFTTRMLALVFFLHLLHKPSISFVRMWHVRSRARSVRSDSQSSPSCRTSNRLEHDSKPRASVVLRARSTYSWQPLAREYIKGYARPSLFLSLFKAALD
jgi:hypothetical protein